VGHGALLTSCIVGDGSLVGQGSIIQEGCDIGKNCIIAAGAVVLPDTVVPEGELWAGNPAVFIRKVTDEEKEGILKVRIDSDCFLLVFTVEPRVFCVLKACMHVKFCFFLFFHMIALLHTICSAHPPHTHDTHTAHTER
jgi:hypothetical protein